VEKPGTDQAVLLIALDYAARKHRTQRRKGEGDTPYINHPVAVARMIAETGGVLDTTTLVAAVLHDTVEDTDATPEEIERAFGPEVRAVVEEVTDDMSLERAVRRRMQVDHAGELSLPARLIKLADKICNIRDRIELPPDVWSASSQMEYILWAGRVIDGLRGANAPLERTFDDICAEANAVLNSPCDDGAAGFPEGHGNGSTA